jgi:hypothetical protein
MPLNEDDRAELVAYLDGELDEAATLVVEARIATDPDARAELDALKQTWGMLDYLPKASPSPNFTNRTLERLTVERVGAGAKMPWPGWRVPGLATACWLASVALAFGAGYFAATQFWPTSSGVEPIPDADREWMELQPKAQREKWEKLRGRAAAEFVAKLRQEEQHKHEQWLIAKRFWKELDNKQYLPSRLADFSDKGKKSDKVKRYVDDYLMPILSPQEKKQLADAEGRWPDFPQTLVELASKQPSALWRVKDPPRKFADLPEPVRKRLVEKKDKTGIAFQKKLWNEIKRYEGPSFASKVVEIARRENKLPFNHEFWASDDKSLLAPMKDFVENKLHPTLDQAEKRKLADSTGYWPEYPLMIQELSQKYSLSPPWLILPDTVRWKWDDYRNSSCRSWGSEDAKEKK